MSSYPRKYTSELLQEKEQRAIELFKEGCSGNTNETSLLEIKRIIDILGKARIAELLNQAWNEIVMENIDLESDED